MSRQFIGALLQGGLTARHGFVCDGGMVRFAAGDHTVPVKSQVPPTHKTKYHVRNWPAYERALVWRGNVTPWLLFLAPWTMTS